MYWQFLRVIVGWIDAGKEGILKKKEAAKENLGLLQAKNMVSIRKPLR